MIIRTVSEYDSSRLMPGVAQRLALYKNVEYAAKRMIGLHAVEQKHHKNVMNQAIELRACLVQADEYFAAAKSASLATRPVLLYYGLMSFALGIILYKGNGGQRLSKLRESNAAHGLSLSYMGDISPKSSVGELVKKLRAQPQLRSGGERYGTFEIWRRSFRTMPVPGVSDYIDDSRGAKSSSTSALLFPEDVEPRVTPKAGYSLEDAISTLPHTFPTSRALGVAACACRATITQEVFESNGQRKLKIVVHPDNADKLERLYDYFKIRPNCLGNLKIKELKSGVILELVLDGQLEFRCPDVVAFESKIVHLISSDWDIGEFGAFYISLSILGNLARYYPDIWMAHVEASSEFALLADAVCESAFERIPTLTASELDRTLYLAKS